MNVVSSSDEDVLEAQALLSYSLQACLRPIRPSNVKFITFHQQPHGPRLDDMEALKPSEHLYDPLMSYNYY